MLQDLMGGGCSKIILQAAKKQVICVEFGDELLTIQNNRKLCRRLTGEILWATHLGKDPKENRNQIMINPKLLSRKARWSNLLQISEQELLKRRDDEWRQGDYRL